MFHCTEKKNYILCTLTATFSLSPDNLFYSFGTHGMKISKCPATAKLSSFQSDSLTLKQVKQGESRYATTDWPVPSGFFFSSFASEDLEALTEEAALGFLPTLGVASSGFVLEPGKEEAERGLGEAGTSPEGLAALLCLGDLLGAIGDDSASGFSAGLKEDVFVTSVLGFFVVSRDGFLTVSTAGFLTVSTVGFFAVSTADFCSISLLDFIAVSTVGCPALTAGFCSSVIGAALTADVRRVSDS